MILGGGWGDVAGRGEPIDAERGGATFDLPRLPEEIGPIRDPDGLASALGLAPQEIGFGNFVPSCWSAGGRLAFIPLRDLDSVRPCPVEVSSWDAIGGHATSAFVFCRETLRQEH